MQLVTIRDLAGMLDKSERTVRTWLTGLSPDVQGGRGQASEYRLERVIRHHWVRDDGESDALDPNRERARKDSETADKLAMENAQKRGELVLYGDIEEHWLREIGEARTALLALPRQMAPRVIGRQKLPEIEAVLDDYIRDALARISETGAAIPEGVEAARKAHGERMGGSESEAEPRG